MFRTAVLISFAVFLQSPIAGNEITPLQKAHAHNDYYHKRPLLDALEQGFCSVEADVFLVENELLVAHSRGELSKDKTLQKLYLDPLQKACRQNNGRVFPNGPTITLLVDLKSEGLSTYKRLHEILSNYDDILTSYDGKETKTRAVNIVISGNRPQEFLASQSKRFAAIDGRLTDVNSTKSVSLMPLISDRWTSHFKYRGIGQMPDADRQKLLDTVKKIHQSGRKVRFWATPDTEDMWKELLKADVDHINTDDLQGLGKFLRSNRKR